MAVRLRAVRDDELSDFIRKVRDGYAESIASRRPRGSDATLDRSLGYAEVSVWMSKELD